MSIWQLAGIIIALLYFFWLILRQYKIRARTGNEALRNYRQERDLVKRAIKGTKSDVLKEIDDYLK